MRRRASSSAPQTERTPSTIRGVARVTVSEGIE
jgi:hypothetical protein